MKRIVSLHLPCFATDRRRRRGECRPSAASPRADDARPLVTVTETSGFLALAAVDAVARAAGLRPGFGLADARARHPDLAVARATPTADARALAALADWCTRYTPWTAADRHALAGGGDHGIWLDITGCAHLFAEPSHPDGEAALLADLMARLAGCGLVTRAAIADTPGAAWALARFGGETTSIIPPGGQRPALAPLPVAALRLPPATVAALARLGLRHIGDLYPLPRAALAARFRDGRLGAAGHGQLIERLDQALGRRDEPISDHNPRLGRPGEPWRARLAPPTTITRVADIAAGLDRLLATLCPRLERQNRGARRLVLTLFRIDATVARVAIGCARPCHDPGHLARLFAEPLAGLRLDDGGGVESLLLEAPRTEPATPTQQALDAGHTPYGIADSVSALVDRLGARLGAANVFRLAPHESHLPERANRRAAPLTLSATTDADRPPWPKSRFRPVHLLPRPEPVMVAESSPGTPRRLVRHGVTHPLAHVEGPERIAPEWWRRSGGEATPRDYYRVEDGDGRRFWLYRSNGAWFLHGLFA